MKINKLDRFETKTPGEPSPEQIQQSRQTFVNLLTPVIEKMQNLPPSNLPLPTWAELIDELKNGSIHRQPTHIISGASEKTNEIFDTKINAKVDTGINTKVDTFTEFELNLLEQIRQNGK
jgi:hypothetical protein